MLSNNNHDFSLLVHNTNNMYIIPIKTEYITPTKCTLYQ
jgi:hypothetical protein